MHERNIGGMSMEYVTGVKVLGPYRLRLTFSDGKRGDVDLSDLRGKGNLFGALSDPAYFRRVRVDEELGTVTWPNGLDLAPEVLYAEAVPPQTSDGPDWHAVGRAFAELIDEILKALREVIGEARSGVGSRSRGHSGTRTLRR
jgi:hypothetical protein